jgi:type IV pilus assembly protein PilO
MNFNLNDLDLSNIARWPAAARAVVILFLMGGVIFLGYWFHIKDQIADLQNAQGKEANFKVIFEKKAQQAANLEAYEQQLAEMRESFGAMLRQLPNKTQVADLLVDISQTGLAAGLEFELFKPEAEQPQDFYAVLPISIRVIGTYHEFGEFVSGVAALPRIVTLHNVKISNRGKKAGGGLLVMDMTAKTYRYLDENERPQEKKGGGSKGGGRKGGRK